MLRSLHQGCQKSTPQLNPPAVKYILVPSTFPGLPVTPETHIVLSPSSADATPQRTGHACPCRAHRVSLDPLPYTCLPGSPRPQPWTDSSSGTHLTPKTQGISTGGCQTLVVLKRRVGQSQSGHEGLIRNANPSTPPPKTLNLQSWDGAWKSATSTDVIRNPVDYALRNSEVKSQQEIFTEN